MRHLRKYSSGKTFSYWKYLNKRINFFISSNPLLFLESIKSLELLMSRTIFHFPLLIIFMPDIQGIYNAVQKVVVLAAFYLGPTLLAIIIYIYICGILVGKGQKSGISHFLVWTPQKRKNKVFQFKRLALVGNRKNRCSSNKLKLYFNLD